MFVSTVESAEHLIQPFTSSMCETGETTRREILDVMSRGLSTTELRRMCASLRWGAHDHGRVFVRHYSGIVAVCIDRIEVITDGYVVSVYQQQRQRKANVTNRHVRRAQHEAYLARREQVMDAILRKQPVAFFDGVDGGVFALDDFAGGYRHACVSVRGTCRALGLSMETMPMGSPSYALFIVWTGQRWRLADAEGMDFDPPREFTSGRVDRRPEW